jgi:hypothetical protein
MISFWPRPGRAVSLLVGSVLVLLSIIAALVPLAARIDDPDFFWHLKTGDWIVAQRALPNEFLFSLTMPAGALDAGGRFVMTSYWLVQVAYHYLYAAWGLTGIVLLRALLMALLGLSLVLRRERDGSLVFPAALLLAVVLMRIYMFERPQAFSFVFFSFLLLALDRARSAPLRAARGWALVIPAITLLWANSHGSFILGQATIALYIAVEGAKFLYPALRPLPVDRYRLLSAWGLLGCLAGFANPNTWHPLAIVRFDAWVMDVNVEYAPSLDFLRGGNPLLLIAYLGVLVLGAAGVLLDRRRDATKGVLFAVLAAASLVHVRLIAFLLIAAVPVIQGLITRERLRLVAALLTVTTALAVSLPFMASDLAGLARWRDAATIDPLMYPVDAAEFVEQEGIRGNMYNFWPWGGYLLWRLYPAKVFADGRVGGNVIGLAQAVEAGDAPPPGVPGWRTILSAYNVSMVIQPIYHQYGGGVLPLTFALLGDPSWVPVYAGENSMLFLRNDPLNRVVIERWGMAGGRFAAVLLERLDRAAARNPGQLNPRIARGDLLAWMGRRAEARLAYEDAARLVPFGAPAARGSRGPALAR